MKLEQWTPTTWLFWAALMVIALLADEFPVIAVAFVAFVISLGWQAVQWITIHRQRKARRVIEPRLF